MRRHPPSDIRMSNPLGTRTPTWKLENPWDNDGDSDEEGEPVYSDEFLVAIVRLQRAFRATKHIYSLWGPCLFAIAPARTQRMAS